MARSQRPLVLGLLGILVALLVVLAVLVSIIIRQDGATQKAAATAAPTFTPTPVLPITASQGWVETQPKLPFARTVAFGTSDPLTGYACGSQGASSGRSPVTQQPVVLQFSRTKDGGRTWQVPQTLPFGQTYNDCALQVDPSDANDVLIGRGQGCDVGACDSGTFAEIEYVWYRSRDGGQTWSLLTYPVKNPGPSVFALDVSFAWNGTTLYAALDFRCVGACIIGQDNAVVVSKKGGAFTEIPSKQIYSALGTNYISFTNISFFQGKLSVYIGYQDKNELVNGSATTGDGGQTWTVLPWTYDSGTVNFELATPTMLYGTYIQGQSSNTSITLVQSPDGGHTWKAFPTQLPSMFSRISQFIVTPDGTFYFSGVETQGQSFDSSILSLLPAATTWQVVAAAAN